MSDQNKELEPQPVVVKKEQERVLFAWRAQARPFQRRNREFWLSVVAVSVIFGFILYVAEGAMPVILLIAVVFLFYILSTVEPEAIDYKITNKGVKVSDQLNGWDLLTRYWFAKRLGSDLLVFETVNIVGRLEIVINLKDKEQIKKAFSDYLPYEQVPATGLDKVTDWVSRKFPGSK